MKRWALDLPYHLKQARKWTKHLKQQFSRQGPATKNDDPLEMGNKRDEPHQDKNTIVRGGKVGGGRSGREALYA